MPACLEQQQLCPPGALSPADGWRGGVPVRIPNRKRTGHLRCANIDPLDHTEVEAKKSSQHPIKGPSEHSSS